MQTQEQTPFITQSELIKGLHVAHQRQQGFITVEVDCASNEISKKCPYHDDIKKISTISGRISSKTNKEGTYERAVNRQLEREGQEPDFTALPSNYLWAEGPFVRYKSTGKLGLAIQVESGSSKWINAKTNQELTPEELEQWQLKKSQSSRQGTDKPITWRVPLIENIQKITAVGFVANVKR